ncbi:MAG: hypothetical protein PVG24_10100 [Gammaproteobacteria bacterium]|jgi:hypothetical protein
MKQIPRAALALATVSIISTALAQEMPDIGFESVGRGRPLAASVNDQPEVGPGWIRGPGRSAREREILGLDGFRPDELPDDIEPLPTDVFTSTDFYADEALWSDPRYFRCNSPMATEFQRGILFPPPLTEEVEEAPWGHCDVDYPREAIVSPYGFETAQAHYEALLEETRERGGPDTYSFADFPAADWNGEYESPRPGTRNQQNWYWGAHLQMSTLLSLLTPEYQQRSVQEAYHQVHGNALWPSAFCWPEGFMRRWYPAAVREHYIIATPGLVQISTGVADNFVTNIHMGREFKHDGVVPYLGEQVPRWYGETIGFWDGETLITWTSNIQGWKSHSLFEFSSQMQSIEIYTPIRDARGGFVGVNHEAIFYDPEALVEPIRIVRNLHKVSDFTDSDETPYTFIECLQTIYEVDGSAVPMSPGAVIEYEVPDMYGRPWAKIWEDNFEQNMSPPDDDEDIFSFE